MPKQTFLNLPADKRDAIVRVAIDEFAEHGYRVASISRLVARAGIAKGSFYQYFEDKRDLYLHLLDRAAEEKLACLRAATPPDPAMGIFAYIRWLFDARLRFEFSHPRLAQLGAQALYGDGPYRGESLQRMRALTREYYRDLIRQGQQQGSIDPRVDPELATLALGAILTEFGLHIIDTLGLTAEDLAASRLSPEHVEAIRGMIDRLLDILEHGLGPSPVERPPLPPPKGAGSSRRACGQIEHRAQEDTHDHR